MSDITKRCRECRYFSYRESVPLADQRPWGQHLDGWCSKIFPRGYVGAGKPGGKVWSGKNVCFQFAEREAKEEDAGQLSLYGPCG